MWPKFLTSSIVLVLMSLNGPGSLQAQPDQLQLIQEQFESHNRNFTELFVHWKTAIEVFDDPGKTFVKVNCVRAIKGEMRFWDATFQWAGGPPISEGLTTDGFMYRKLSYDGKTTRYFQSGVGTIYSGSEEYFAHPQSMFMSAQGHTRDGQLFQSFDNVIVLNNPMFGNLANLSKTGKYIVAEEVKINGIACIQLQGSPNTAPERVGDKELGHAEERIYLDPARNYAIVRRDVSVPKFSNDVVRYSFNDLQEARPGLWLANSIVIEGMRGDKVKYRETVRVLELKVDDVSDDLFHIDFAPGTYISDFSRSHPAAGPEEHTHGDVTHTHSGPNATPPILTYHIPVNPDELEKTIANAQRLQGSDVAQSFLRRASRWWLLAVNIIVILVIAGVLWKRHSAREDGSQV